MKHGSRLVRIFSLLALSLTINSVLAAHFNSPVISIIIDDIGYRHIDDQNALELPGPVTYAILPHAPLSLKLSQIARKSGKSVILHLPMEAIENDKNRFLGPGALRLEMNESEFIDTLSENIQSLPDIVGVNNHMGSLITMQNLQMEWLMEYLKIRNIFYVDSLTNSETVASDIAQEKNVPILRRDVFLDNNQDIAYISAQFDELVRIARLKGMAIAIGHPHPETIEVLRNKLPSLLRDHGVKLISLSDMLKASHQDRLGRISLNNRPQ